MSPTQRSLAALRADGWTVQIVERWCSFSRRRIDLFGFGDLLCIKASFRGAMIVQCCAGASFAARLDKILLEPKAGIWLAAGNSILIQAWRKVGPRGKRKVWRCREQEVKDLIAIQEKSQRADT